MSQTPLIIENEDTVVVFPVGKIQNYEQDDGAAVPENQTDEKGAVEEEGEEEDTSGSQPPPPKSKGKLRSTINPKDPKYTFIQLDKKLDATSGALPVLELYTWIELNRGLHLTLGDLMGWEVGKTYKVVMFDRNFEEYHIWDNTKQNTPYEPEDFFQQNEMDIVYHGNMEWTLNMKWGEFEHPVHFDVASLDRGWTWSPVDVHKENPNERGISITGEPLCLGEKLPKGKTSLWMSWSEFPPDTRVGWRGPMMMWDTLKYLPLVYHAPLEQVDLIEKPCPTESKAKIVATKETEKSKKSTARSSTARSSSLRRTATLKNDKRYPQKPHATRDGPPFPASHFPKQRKRGNDGTFYESVAKKNGVYWWRKVRK